MSPFIAAVGTAQEMEEVGAFVVVLAGRHDGGGVRLELQRALGFLLQDRQLGMDTYCLCRETGETHYGGVLSWRVEPAVLSLSLDDKAAADLGVDRTFFIELGLTAPEIEASVQGIERELGFPRSD